MKTREDLLTARRRQLDQKVLMENHASQNIRNSRNTNKVYFDQIKQLRKDKLHIGDLILVHQTKDSYSRNRAKKLDDRWFGPYRIREIPDDSTFYYLEELDGTHLKPTFAGNRLKRLFSRVELDNNRSEAHETIRVRDALDLDPMNEGLGTEDVKEDLYGEPAEL